MNGCLHGKPPEKHSWTKVGRQVEGWQNIKDFENVLGGPSMNMIIIIWKGLAPCFADGNPHAYCGCGSQVNAPHCNFMALNFPVIATPYNGSEKEEAKQPTHPPCALSIQLCL
jgi:hypothetical protein